jgi:hypothetical protein
MEGLVVLVAFILFDLPFVSGLAFYAQEALPQKGEHTKHLCLKERFFPAGTRHMNTERSTIRRRRASH